MSQIMQNYFYVFIVPFLIGVALRFLCRRVKRGYLVTAAFVVLALIGWGIYHTVFSHGSELYWIIALHLTSAAMGAFLTELLLRLKKDR